MLIQTKSNDLVEIDVEDLELVSGLPWRLSNGYPAYGDAGRLFYMHRVLLAPMRHQVVDHINGSRLDNRRANLRVCSHAQNMKNRKRASTNRSGFKGVYLQKRTGKWRAEIKANGRKYFLGQSFRTPEEAHEVYCLAAEMLHGRYANYG